MTIPYFQNTGNGAVYLNIDTNNYSLLTTGNFDYVDKKFYGNIIGYSNTGQVTLANFIEGQQNSQNMSNRSIDISPYHNIQICLGIDYPNLNMKLNNIVFS